MRFIRKIHERGTITIPTEIREVLGVGESDIVEFEIVRVIRRAEHAPKPGKDAPAAPSPVYNLQLPPARLSEARPE